MVTVVSRFRVRNGMEADVRRAFHERPGLVEEAEGFRGLDVHHDADDPTVFYLITRWARREHFEAWHGSDAHKESHAGIPAGLKLDPDYTRVTVMERFHPAADAEDAPDWIHRAGAALASLAATSPDVHSLVTDRAGRLRGANAAAVDWLGRSPEELLGTPLSETGEAEWQEVVEYLKEHSLFLSHGYCPDCSEAAAATLGQDAREARE